MAAESLRLGKERARIEAEVGKASAKLASPTFADRAPPEVVEKTRQTLAEWQDKLQRVETMISALN